MANEATGIFIEENFDYAHFIPNHPKCYPLHGHTAKVEIKLYGRKEAFDMILDFGELKNICKKVISNFDHKLIASKKYVKAIQNGLVEIEYNKFRLFIPLENVYMLENEVTSENLSEELSKSLLENLPSNIEIIEVRIYEGNRKGAFTIRRR